MKSLGLTLLTLGLLVAFAPTAPAQEEGQTSFTLTAHADGSTFYFQGEDGTKNPTLVVPANTEITVTLRNVGEGVHNIHVDGASPSDYVQGDGDEITYTFTSPASGTKQYWCDPHKSSGMVGTVRVAGSPDTGGNGGGNGETGNNESPGVQVVGVAVALLGAALLLRRK